MVITGSSLTIMGLVAVVGYLGSKWFLQKDHEKEQRRRAANAMARTLREHGLKYVPDFLEDYGVGDYSGMASKVRTMGELFLSGEGPVVLEFEKAYERILEAKVKTEEGRALLTAKLKANAPAAPEEPTAPAPAPKSVA